MKNYMVFLILLLLFSCNKDDSQIEHQVSTLDLSELSGIWFRSTPIRFGALHGNPAFERGEYHIELNFQPNGVFQHRYTALGFYENQNPTDSTSITIHEGTFELAKGFLSITRNSRTYVQIFDGEQITRDTTIRETVLQHDYQWPNVERTAIDSLKFTYHTLTDMVSPEQIAPGIDLREESYKRK